MAIEDTARTSLSSRQSVLLLILLGIGVLYPLGTSSDIVYSRHSDIIAQHASIQTIGREAVREEGRLPLWNPSMNGGAPAFANPEAMYLFPLNLLFLALPLGRATNLVILLNFLSAGLGMLLFCRRHLRHPAAALACAAAYMLSHRALAMIYAGWLPKMSMYALTPLLFWACDLVLDRPDRRRIAGLAIVGALALVQGDMQQLYYAAVACVIYIFLRLGAAGWRRSGPTLSRLALGGLLALMLAAPAMLPRLEFAALSTRTEPNREFLLKDSPAPAELRSFFNPHDQNAAGEVRNEFWENSFYFGCWLAPLWLAAFCGKRRRAALGLLLGMSLMAFLCFDTPVLRWLYDHLPGFNLFRQSSRILFLAQFVAVALAGLGVDALLARLPRLGRIVLTGLLLMAPVVDYALRLAPLISTQPLAKVLPRTPFLDLLDRNHTEGRVLAIEQAVLSYGTAGYYGIDLVNGYTALQLRHYIDYFTILQDVTPAAIPKGPVIWTDCRRISKPEMLRALDVRYIVGDPSLNLDAMGYERIAEAPAVPRFVFYRGVLPVPVAVWRLKDPLGPAYFAVSVHPVAGREESLQSLALATSALDARVFGLDRDVRGLDFSGGTAVFIERGLNRYRYRIASRGDNFLILSQIWYPGWRAKLDGRLLKLYRTNHALLGCFIPAGAHELTLEMTSPPLCAGLVLAAIAAAGILLLFRPFAGPGRNFQAAATSTLRAGKPRSKGSSGPGA